MTAAELTIHNMAKLFVAKAQPIMVSINASQSDLSACISAKRDYAKQIVAAQKKRAAAKVGSDSDRGKVLPILAKTRPLETGLNDSLAKTDSGGHDHSSLACGQSPL